jgi:hypothetical protein
MDPVQLVVNSTHVVHETIDDETILIHLGTGVYYSLDASGSAVWRLAAAGVPAADIADALTAAHPEAAGVADGVRALVSRLAEEELLIPGHPDELPAGVEVESIAGSFAAPVLQRYTDMQEFMLVDPLHEVDEQAGWPHAKAG